MSHHRQLEQDAIKGIAWLREYAESAGMDGKNKLMGGIDTLDNYVSHQLILRRFASDDTEDELTIKLRTALMHHFAERSRHSPNAACCVTAIRGIITTAVIEGERRGQMETLLTARKERNG